MKHIAYAAAIIASALCLSPERAAALNLGKNAPGRVQAGTSTPKRFTDNLDEALAKAASEKKKVYACFSGSDWCGWCKRLESEILSKDAFLSAAEKDFVLVYIDSPSNENLLSPWAKEHNPKLVKKYEIKGFPTALVLDKDGKVLATTGYKRLPPQKYASHLKAIVKNRDKIRDVKKEIEKLERRLAELETGD